MHLEGNFQTLEQNGSSSTKIPKIQAGNNSDSLALRQQSNTGNTLGFLVNQCVFSGTYPLETVRFRSQQILTEKVGLNNL